MRRPTQLRASLFLFALVLGYSLSAQQQRAPQLQILRAQADLVAGTLVITGVNFGTTTPSVTLGGTPLTVLGSTPQQITAALPSGIQPGTYAMAVSTGASSLDAYTLDVTIGAVGPPGPQGPQGPAGPQGPQGPPGLPPPDVSVRLISTTPLSVASDSEVVLSFDHEQYDTANTHDTQINPERLVAPQDGKYYIFATVEFTANSVGSRQVKIRKNGQTFIALTQVNAVTSGLFPSTVISCDTHYFLRAGEYLELMVRQNSGTTLSIALSPEYSPVFGMVKLP